MFSNNYHDLEKVILWNEIKILQDEQNYTYFHYPNRYDGSKNIDGNWIISDIVLSALIDENENFSEPSNDVKADIKKVDGIRAELPKDIKMEIKKHTEDIVFPKKSTHAVKLRVVPKKHTKYVPTFVGRECDFPALSI